jgi:hypothetical protein
MAYDLNKLAETYKNLNKKAKEKQEKSGDSIYFKIEEGSNPVRVLPSKDDNFPFFVHSKLHGVNLNGQLRYYHCRKMHNEPCPLCEAYYEMWKQHKAGNTKIAETFGKGNTSIKPKDRYYVNVINRKDDSVKVMALPEKLFRTLMSYMVGDEELGIEALGDITDVNNGYDFNVIATKQDKFLDYSQSRMKTKTSPAGQSAKQIEEFLSARHDLIALIKNEDFTELKQIADTILSGAATAVKTDSEPTKEASEEEFKKSLKG